MNTTLTPYLAVWGAALSTVTFIWNFWKWHREAPLIAAKVEAHESLEEDGLGAIHYELRNRGGKPTTIEEIMLVKYQPGFRGLLRQYEICENESVANRETVKLPVVLKPGELWKGYSVIDREHGSRDLDKNALILTGQLFWKVRCAHNDRLLSGKVRPERWSSRL